MKRNTLQQVVVLLLFMVVGLFSSCSKEQTAGGLMGASGKPYDVLLVIDKGYLSDGVADTVKRVLQRPVLAMPQEEASMKVQTVATQDFDGFLQFVRNILIVEINHERFTQASVKFAYDRWAGGQVVVMLNAPDVNSLNKFLEENGAALVNLFMRSELFNFATEHAKAYSAEADNRAMRLFNKHISIPQDIVSYKEGKDFLWMSNNAIRKRLDVTIYRLPYDGRKLTGEYLLAVRDSVMAENIPGGIEGSYATTAKYELYTRNISIADDKESILELRGLWEMTGGEMMGGPFVLHARIDEDRKYVYFVEGFVYHPNENKRDLMQNLESSLFTFRSAEQKLFDPAPLRRMQWTKTEPLSL